MEHEQIKALFRNITVWKRRAERAPHKPLLLLYALGKCSRHEAHPIPFSEIDRELTKLLVEFGPPRRSYHPEYPFWRLQNDGLWELQHAENIARRTSSTDARKSELLRLDVTGSLKPAIYHALAQNPRLLQDIVQEILEAHFPSSMHEDILDAVGLRHRYEYRELTRRVRDPKFRYQVLVAYEQRCAVCGFDVRVDHRQIGIEAAHIQWVQAGGPDVTENGLALCALHHKLFDRGAFTLSEARQVRVSEHAHGSTGLEEWLLRFHDRPLRSPVHPRYLPEAAYIRWHWKEVFRGPSR
jgi:putative restriction endonuclease